MGLYSGAVITSAGQNLLAQAISGTELTWTVMRASSVAIPEGTDLTTLTALTGIEQTSGITDASVYGSNVVQVSARFSNTGIDTAYLMETVGIYGQVTGGSETLIAVMTAETPDEMPVYDQDSPSAFIFNVQMSVQNANTITMVVNDTGTATVADLQRKVDLIGGDLSDTVVDTFTAATAEYPVPAAGDTMRVIGGKIMKFCADIVKTFTGASASAAGKKGLVPAPAAGRNTYYLRGDSTWQAPVNDNTTTVAGRVLDARQANPNISGTIAANVKSLNDSLNAATVSFQMVGVASQTAFYFNSCVYDPVSKRVHLMFEGTCAALSTGGTICRVPAAYKPASSVQGIVLKSNGEIRNTLQFTLDTNGAVLNGDREALTSFTAVFDYYTK